MLDPRRRRPSPWVLASFAILVLSIIWRLASENDEPQRERLQHLPKQRVAVRPSESNGPPPQTPEPTINTQPVEESLPPPPTLSIDTRTTPPEPPPPEPRDESAAPIDVPEPEPALPPCPEPAGDIRSAWSARDWGAVHEILGQIVTRQDCDPGSWQKLSWAYYEASALLVRNERRHLENPVPVFRSAYTALLSLLDGESNLREVEVETVDVSSPDAAGYRHVDAIDPKTGEPVTVLTRQDASSGQMLSLWGIDEPGADSVVVRDMSSYAGLVDRSIFDRLQTDADARQRLPEEMRREFDRSDGKTGVEISAGLSRRREALRRMALEKLDELEASDSQAYEEDVRMERETLRKREEELYEAMGEILKHDPTF